MAQVKDVVCGMMVDPEKAPAKAEYKGKAYHFCSPGCRAAFEKDPDKYLKAEAEEGHKGGHCHCCC